MPPPQTMRKEIDALDAHALGGEFDLLPRPRELIAAPAVHALGAVFGGKLIDLPNKAGQHALDLRPGRHSPRGPHGALAVQRIRRHAEAEVRKIRLFLVEKEVEQPRRIADADGQHARSERVERPHVAAGGMHEPPHARNDIGRAGALLLPDVQKSRHTSPMWLRTA